MKTSEPSITINGRILSTAQAMTMRAALESFMEELRSNGLGDDEHGKAITTAYLQRGAEITQMIFGGS